MKINSYDEIEDNNNNSATKSVNDTSDDIINEPPHIKVINTIKVPCKNNAPMSYSPVSNLFYSRTIGSVKEHSGGQYHHEILTFKWGAIGEEKFNITPILDTISISTISVYRPQGRTNTGGYGTLELYKLNDFIEYENNLFLTITHYTSPQQTIHDTRLDNVETKIEIINNQLESDNIISKVPYTNFLYLGGVFKGISVDIVQDNSGLTYNNSKQLLICDLDFQSQNTVKKCIDKSSEVPLLFKDDWSGSKIYFSQFAAYQDKILILGSIDRTFFIYQFDQELNYIKKFHIRYKPFLDYSKFISDNKHLYLVRSSDGNLEWRVIELVD